MTLLSWGDRGVTARPGRRLGTRLRIRRLMGLMAALDFLILGLAVVLAWALRLNLDLVVWAVDARPEEALSATVGPWVVMAWMVALLAEGTYDPRRFAGGAEEFKSLLRASVFAAGLVGLTCYLLKFDLSRGFLVLTFAVGIPMLMLERYAVLAGAKWARQRGRLLHRVVAVGGASSIEELVRVLHRERRAGYEVVGACLPANAGVSDGVLSVPRLGDVARTRQVCEQVDADAVLVTHGGFSSSEDLRRIAWDLEGTDIDLIVVPSLTDVAGPRIHVRPVAGLPLLHLEEPQADRARGSAKRLFDIVFASAALVLLSPVMLAAAAVVKLADGGPVFYRQTRVGIDERTFRCLKFRSMAVDADELLDDLHGRNEGNGVLFKLREDPRVTRVGRMIRKYSIDELPQLLNVLRGEMSLVGPRPPLPHEVRAYHADMTRRLKVRPGMTGLWQVSGRSNLSAAESERLDLYYVDNWSMVTDLGIILRTFKAVASSHGAF